MNIGGSLCDPTAGRVAAVLNLGMIAEFESDLFGMRATEGMKAARPRVRLCGSPKLRPAQEAHLSSCDGLAHQ